MRPNLGFGIGTGVALVFSTLIPACAGQGSELDPASATSGKADCSTGECSARPHFVAMAAGDHHTCAATEAGKVACWGLNEDGQLGLGAAGRDVIEPTFIPGLSGVVALAAGYAHTCALTEAGGVLCWGDGSYGKLGDDTGESRPSPVAVYGLGNGVAAITAGVHHTCALLRSGGVKCWGHNYKGELGDNAQGALDRYLNINHDQKRPVDVVGLKSGGRKIVARNDMTCALLETGAVTCWGKGQYGVFGDGETDPFHFVDEPVSIPGLTQGITDIAVGSEVIFALTQEGTVKMAGNPLRGMALGSDWPAGPEYQPLPASYGGFTALAAGGVHACGKSETGAVRCWGYNAWGAIGDGSTIDPSQPSDVVGLPGQVKELSLGANYSCALTIDHRLLCWGARHGGVVGVAVYGYDATPQPSPIEIAVP